MHNVSIHNYEKHIEKFFSLLYFIKIMIHLAWEANFMLIFNQASIKLSKGFRAGEENKKLEEKRHKETKKIKKDMKRHTETKREKNRQGET